MRCSYQWTHFLISLACDKPKMDATLKFPEKLVLLDYDYFFGYKS